MQSGKLRDYITIQEYSEVFNDYRELVPTWITFESVFASIKSVSGREYLQNSKDQGDTIYRIRIRFLDGVNPSMRVLFGSIVYEIEVILPDRKDDRNILLMCRKLET